MLINIVIIIYNKRKMIKLNTRWQDVKEFFDWSVWRKEFKCWVVHGHCWDKTNSSRMSTGQMNRCKLCDKYDAGPDGWH